LTLEKEHGRWLSTALQTIKDSLLLSTIEKKRRAKGQVHFIPPQPGSTKTVDPSRQQKASDSSPLTIGRQIIFLLNDRAIMNNGNTKPPGCSSFSITSCQPTMKAWTKVWWPSSAHG
jgi:hypothetical protein